MTGNSIVGIISDSHDHRENIKRAVEIFNEAQCSLVVHAGDFVAPFTAREFKKLSCPLVGVFGNNDGERRGLTLQYEKIGELNAAPHEFTHAGRSFVVMHEPFYLEEYGKRKDIDVVIYGHTHKIDIKPSTPMIINPGESCSWLTGRPTVVLLDCETLETELIDLN